jgi:hypothetical protein
MGRIKNYFEYVVSLLEFNDTTTDDLITKQKEIERSNAMKSALRQNVFNGIQVRISTHAASQAKVRRSDLEVKDWNIILDRITKYIKSKDLFSESDIGDYLFYSKSYEEGVICGWDTKRLIIITSLPKGRFNKKPDTDLVMVEDVSMFNGWMLIYEEID